MGVKIKGKEYPIRTTMWSQLQFKRDKGKALSDLKDDDLEDMIYYTWLCVKGACLQEGVEFDISFEDYTIHVEGDPTEALLLSQAGSLKKKEREAAKD